MDNFEYIYTHILHSYPYVYICMWSCFSDDCSIVNQSFCFSKSWKVSYALLFVAPKIFNQEIIKKVWESNVSIWICFHFHFQKTASRLILMTPVFLNSHNKISKFISCKGNFHDSGRNSSLVEWQRGTVSSV